MTDTFPPTEPAPARGKVVLGGIAALLIAAAVVVVFVMPAEYGKDPTGIGSALGLTKLSEPGKNEEQLRGEKRVGVLAALDGPITAPDDRYVLELGPFESGEFKYTLKEGDKMRFSWEASGPVDYDMHSHPFDGGTELTESYAVTKGSSQSGIYTAQFTGIHGWYWQNRTMDNVTVTLDAAGPMTASTVFSQVGESARELTPPGAAEPES